MSRPVVSALLFVATALLALDVGLRLNEWGEPRQAYGQDEDGDYGAAGLLITGSQTQNEAFCYIYNPRTQQLISYRNRASGGIELMGIRNCASDFNPKIIEFPRSASDKAVRKMNELAERLAKEDKK